VRLAPDSIPGKDAFLDSGTGRVHGVIHTVLAFLHLDLSRTADPDHRNTVGELGEPLL
jgi:hypothetical protein